MTDTIAIVTGGLRGLGRAMTLGLLGQGHRVTAVGHIKEDVDEMLTTAGASAERLLPLVADLRRRPSAIACSLSRVADLVATPASSSTTRV